MIKRLRNRVLITIMFFVTIIIVAFVAIITIVPQQMSRQQAQNFLEQLNDIKQPPNPPRMDSGIFNEKPMPNQPPEQKKDNIFFSANMVTANLDVNGNVLNWSSSREDLYDDDYVQNSASEILNKNKEFGTHDGQYYMLKKHIDGYFLALLDNSVALENAKSTLILSSVTGIVVWFVLLLLAILFVNKMTKPIGEAFEKQRQFISDAGHELKTPISVVAANANVLHSEIGQSKWLSYIQSENKRMELLVGDLMTLAEIDDDSKRFERYEFNLSNAILSAALPFESLAFEKGIVIQFDVQPDIMYFGNEEKLQRLAIILLSNAVKYGSERGIIRVTLLKDRKKTFLKVYNTGQGIEDSERTKIFDRFYRVDKARSRESGGHGLGLAIAQAIVQEHGGHIWVNGEYGSWIEFNVLLIKS